MSDYSGSSETIYSQRKLAEEFNQTSFWEVFKGTNGWRTLIAMTPKCLQQLTGLAVVNSYSTCVSTSSRDLAFRADVPHLHLLRLILVTSSSESRRSLLVCPFYAEFSLPLQGWPETRCAVPAFGLVHKHGLIPLSPQDPFTVTVILACVQMISILMTAFLTDSIGRRPMTVYGFFLAALAVLAVGILGLFDYTSVCLAL